MKNHNMDIQKAREICQRFANDHKLVFEDEGEVGFGRPCVGFIKGSGYVDHNPYNRTDYAPIEELEDERLYPPSGVNAYHKHDCLCVLGHDDDAIIGLAHWVEHLESLGPVEVVQYATGAGGVQVLFSGVVGYAVRVKSK